ncbi:MAG: peptidoglycan-binding domain-containing protein [Candidatus Omnitrophica bacterium]|nr:peptidoglycan-binding domain-containing protein [Candidatus Omnitrophota bacterium]
MRKWIVLVTVMFFAASLSGCATARKQKELELQGLKNQVSVLEAQVQSKDEEINGLKDQLAKTQQETELKENAPVKVKVVGSIKTRPKAKHIQIALANAGYDPGKIDGKIGTKTKEAIRAFQKANSLSVTGKADKKTWEVLREYLYKKTK